jgi:alanyl-tRNA synthetase
MLDGIMDNTRKSNKEEISGKDAFVLYDTFGFPIDLTELILRENNLKVDMEGFKVELEAQKERSRSASSVETHDWQEVYKIDEVEFVGYDSLESW